MKGIASLNTLKTMYDNTRNLPLNFEASIPNGAFNKISPRQQSEKPWAATTERELSSTQLSKPVYNQGRNVSANPSPASQWSKEISTQPPPTPIADLTLDDLRIVPKTNHKRSSSGVAKIRELGLNSSRDPEAAPEHKHGHQQSMEPRMPKSHSRNGSIGTSTYQLGQPDRTPAGISNVVSAPNSQGSLGIGQGSRTSSLASPMIVVSSSASERDLRNAKSTPRILGANEFISTSPGEQAQSPVPSVSPSASPAPSFPANDFYCKAVVQAISDSQIPPPAKIVTGPSSLPPPRPVRLNSPLPRTPSATSSSSSLVAHDVKQASQQPQLTSHTTSTRPNNSDAVHPGMHEDWAKKTTNPRSATAHSHIREGAYPPSTILYSGSKPQPAEAQNNTLKSSYDGSEMPPTVTTSLARNIAETIYEEKEENAAGVDKPHLDRQYSHDFARSSEEGGTHSLGHLDAPAMSSERSLASSATQSSLQSPPSRLKNAVLKRLSSLPRTPSTRSTRRLSQSESVHSKPSSASPSISPPPLPSSSSPPLPPLPSLPTRTKKIKCQDPAALWCSEILSLKNPAERSSVYTQKINELHLYDCGLAEWLSDTNLARSNRSSRPLADLRSSVSLGTSNSAFQPKPRHASPSSIFSEATFPMRPDASVATDLTPRSQDSVPLIPPALPYPSLALAGSAPPRSSSLPPKSNPSPTSFRKLNGGFFSNLGRRTSLKRGKTALPSPSTPSAPPTKPPPEPQQTKRPVDIRAAPTVPGGPRAAPHLNRRSKSIMVSSSARVDQLKRSTLTSSTTAIPAADNDSDPEFRRQLDKLRDLLPHADRDVLALYLRRSGQDIVAIGRYLEDERTGAIKLY